jgi:competence protein ComEA
LRERDAPPRTCAGAHPAKDEHRLQLDGRLAATAAARAPKPPRRTEKRAEWLRADLGACAASSSSRGHEADQRKTRKNDDHPKREAADEGHQHPHRIPPRLVGRRGARALALPFSAPLGGPAEAQAQAPSVAPEAPGVVNINTATVEQLTRLPGIGETRAEAILAARQARPFRRVQEIMRVRGIGRATFRKLRPMLAVEGETTLPASRR